jgi:ABC-type multidrug transport system fused ATPase/permease subunit
MAFKEGGLDVWNRHGARDDDGTVEIRGDEFGRCMKLYRWKCSYVIGLVLTILAGASPVLLYVFMGDFMTVMVGGDPNGLKGRVSPALWKLFGMLMAMAVVTAAGFGIRIYLNPNYMAELQKACFGSLMELDIGFFDEVRTGALVARISEDITLVR